MMGILDRLPHVFSVVGVEVSLQSLLMFTVALEVLYASYQSQSIA